METKERVRELEDELTRVDAKLRNIRSYRSSFIPFLVERKLELKKKLDAIKIPIQPV